MILALYQATTDAGILAYYDIVNVGYLILDVPRRHYNLLCAIPVNCDRHPLESAVTAPGAAGSTGGSTLSSAVGSDRQEVELGTGQEVRYEVYQGPRRAVRQEVG